jgi:hypothetical protein
MAFEYNDEIKNILLSMSFDERLPEGASVGYGAMILEKNVVPASGSINLTCVRNQTITQGSGSFLLNGIKVLFTGSTYVNTPQLLHIDTGSFASNTLASYVVTSSNIINSLGLPGANTPPSMYYYPTGWGTISSSIELPNSIGVFQTYSHMTGSNVFYYTSCSIFGTLPEVSSTGVPPAGPLGAVVIDFEENISFPTASLQIFIPTTSSLDYPSRASASLSSLIDDYTNYFLTADQTISTQLIYAPGEVQSYVCSATCYQGENPWLWGGVLYPATLQNPVNRQTIRPLKGGVSITSTNQALPLGAGGRGTMGLVCQDSASNALVGLTNNHVIIKDPFYTDQRSFLGLIQNEYDVVDSSNTIEPDFVYQTGESQPVNPSGPNRIGQVLRYVPLYTSASTVANNTFINNSDAAIFSIYCSSSDGTPILNFTSPFQQLGLNYTASMPFASTAEINNLMNTNPELYSSGRTTGAKGSPGTLCPLRIFGYQNSNVAYNLQGTQTVAFMQDLIAFVKPNDSASYSPPIAGASVSVCPYPAWAGDSGSTLIANIGGIWKIVGLVFAGNGAPYGTFGPFEVASSMGLACRIDHIADQLKIKAWTGSIAPIVDNDSIAYFTVSGSNDDKILNCSGSDYFQVGLTKKHKFC